MNAFTYDHIHASFRHIMALSKEQRLEFLDQPRWIGYSAARQVLDMLQGLLHKPKQPRMPNLLLVGESNNGKTTIVERFYQQCGQGFVTENNEPAKPVIVAEAPPSADEKGLLISILEQFYSPYRASDSAIKLRHQVIHNFRTCHVKMLVIDEFHSLLTGSPIKQREVMNVIKLLCNELAIPIVGVGTREAVRVLHTDPQHASRFDVLVLPRWELNADFQRFLAGFEQALPLKKPSKISSPESATLIHTISEGITGNVRRLLAECAKQAIETDAECIDKSLIQQKSWVRPTQGIRELKL